MLNDITEDGALSFKSAIERLLPVAGRPYFIIAGLWHIIPSMEYFAKSDTGNCREQNEDFFYACENLFIVADGMGGHNAGEIASRTAVDSFVEYFFSRLKKNTAAPKKSGAFSIIKIMLEAASFANGIVYKQSLSKKEYSGMGTTFTACFILNKTASILHVGDSRVYLFADGNFTMLTKDHTLVGKMYRNGLLTYEETFNHPLRNYLENVLGLSDTLDSDTQSLNVSEGNIMVICSDGLNSMLRDKEIFSTVQKYQEPQKMTEKLISLAKKNGGLDNITVITIKI